MRIMFHLKTRTNTVKSTKTSSRVGTGRQKLYSGPLAVIILSNNINTLVKAESLDPLMQNPPLCQTMIHSIIVQIFSHHCTEL